MKSKSIKVDPQDLWIMLLSTVRYSMGRQTYMCSLSCNLVEKFGKYLRPDQLDQVYNEVVKELQAHEDYNKTLGSSQDHKTWKDFAKTYTEARWGKVGE